MLWLHLATRDPRTLLAGILWGEPAGGCGKSLAVGGKHTASASYAGDGIDDAWQNQYFGLNNPNAAPNVDFDGTGQTNLFKYIAGLNRLDPNSRFTLSIAPVPGQPTQKILLFTPLATGRTYTVKFKTDVTAATWTTLPGVTFTDNGLERTVTDPTATEARKFYQVEISKP